MLASIIAIAVFLGVFLGILTINFWITDMFKQDQSDLQRKAEMELRAQMREHARKTTAQGELHSIEMALEGRPSLSAMQLIKQFKQKVDQAGLKVDPQLIGFLGLAGGSTMGLCLFFLFQSWLLALVTIAIGFVLPVLYIFAKRSQRMNLMAEQLPEALELMARVLRAGQTVPQAMNGVADEFPEPIGSEFGFCYEQQNLGLSMDVALKNMVERTGLIEIKILVMSIAIQRQAGGNLAEMFGTLSETMRQRQTLRGSVKALTAEGRMQALVLLMLPFFIWFTLLVINRPYALRLFEYPTLMYGMMGLMGVGMVWIREIVNFDF